VAEREPAPADVNVRRYLPKSVHRRPFPGAQSEFGIDQATVPALVAALASTAVFVGHREHGELENLHSGEIIPTIATLRLPAGSYAIFAKMNLTRDDTTASVIGNEVTCVLSWGNDVDLAQVMVEGWKADVTVAPSTSYMQGATEMVISLMITHDASVAGEVVLAGCAGPEEAEPSVGKISYRDLRLIAIGAERIFTQEL